MRKTLVVTLALLLAGCATAPEQIAPQYVSQIQYENLNCRRMNQERLRLEAALIAAFAAQNNARGNDAMGVLLIGVPTSSLSGSNQSGYVARLKGELEALQRAAIAKGCSIEFTTPDAIMRKQREEARRRAGERRNETPRERMMKRK